MTRRFPKRAFALTPMRLRHILVLIGLLGTTALASASCGGDDERSSARPETVASLGLNGTYEMAVAEEDLTESGGAEPGRWTMTIKSGDATLDGPGGRHIPLTPTVLSETEMVVPPDPMCPNNQGQPGEGVYDVELSGDSLEFTEVRDTCGDRAFTLTVHMWRRTAS